jgi:hypothetical protein
VKTLFTVLSILLVVLGLLGLLLEGGTTALVLLGFGMAGIAIAAYNRR